MTVNISHFPRHGLVPRDPRTQNFLGRATVDLVLRKMVCLVAGRK